MRNLRDAAVLLATCFHLDLSAKMFFWVALILLFVVRLVSFSRRFFCLVIVRGVFLVRCLNSSRHMKYQNIRMRLIDFLNEFNIG